MRYSKPSLSRQDQIGLLKGRGLTIVNEPRAVHYLANISYYRLRAYMMPFQNANDTEHHFREGTTFDDLLDLYIFDRELRLLVFDAIERIEVALRTQIIHQYSLGFGSHWYEDPTLYWDNFSYSRNLGKLDEEMDRSNEIFIKHYKNKYTSPVRPPAWMTLEITTMGLLSKLFKGLRNTSEKRRVASHFNLSHPKVLESWIHCISYVRNICAHHSRLWNRTLTIRPKLPKKIKGPWLNEPPSIQNRLYIFLCCTYYLLKVINPTTSFKTRLIQLVAEYPNVPLEKMGFPQDWEEQPLWNQD